MRSAAHVVRRSALLASLAVSLVSVSASARSMTITGFDATVTVSADGAIDVTETIAVDFEGAWQGLYRTIPVEYRTAQGVGHNLLLEITKVTDSVGNPLRYDGYREGRYRKLKVFLPGAVDTHKVVVVGYRVPNALRFFADHDELYWNVTGDEWDVPVGTAAARIELPAGTTGLRADVYTGPPGSKAHDATSAVGERAVDVRTTVPLGLREGLTVAISWNKGVVRAPTALTRAAWFARASWPFGLPLAAALFMTCLWLAHGRDPRRRPIRQRGEPPVGLTPAEAGALVVERGDTTQVVATIVDLATRGYLTITLDGRYVFRLQKQRDHWSALKAHERLILAHLFSGGTTTVRSSLLQYVFYRHLPEIRTAVFEALVARGYYRQRPDRVRRRYVIAAVLTFLAILGLIPVAAQLWGTFPSSLILSGALTAFVVGLIGRWMPTRTEKGARALEEVLGFKAFLEAAAVPPRGDGEHARRFETSLPFTIALQVDQRWATAFGGLGVSSPSWYSNPDEEPYDPYLFSQQMNVMSVEMDRTLSSVPASSDSAGSGGSSSSWSSSGSDGGGSSGGGDGGGGGGGF